MTRPNVLWISTHDINPHLGTYAGVWPGAEQASTPNLDRLAAQGVRYDNAFATAPVCAPSRSSIMTGCFPTAIGTHPMRTKAVPPPEVHLLSEYFRAAGYFTTNSSFTDFQVDTPMVLYDELGDDAHWRHRPEGAPFFSAFHGLITHESRIYLDDEEFAAATSHVQADQRHDPEAVSLPPYHPDTEVFRRSWARYLDLVTEMDHWAGQILAELEGDGLAESTIVVFWSDHGLGMPRGKRWVYESGLREPLIVRWPGRLAPGQARTELVHLMDLAPTMLTMCGLDVPEHMHGKAFLDADGSPHAPNEYVFAARDRMDEQEDASRTVRDERYRYIRHLHPDRSGMQYCYYPDHLDTWAEMRRLTAEEGRQLSLGTLPDQLTPLQRGLTSPAKGAAELYDLQADPFETVNLADDPAHAEVVARLDAALDWWTATYGDLGLVPEAELIERWRPHGVAPVTSPPVARLVDGTLELDCPTDGATLGWTTTPPGREPPRPPMARAVGTPADDGRRWRLYAGPVSAPAGTTVWVRAWRLGWEPSDEVEVAPAG